MCFFANDANKSVANAAVGLTRCSRGMFAVDINFSTFRLSVVSAQAAGMVSVFRLQSCLLRPFGDNGCGSESRKTKQEQEQAQ